MVLVLTISLTGGLVKANQDKPLIYLPFETGSEWRCVQGPGGSFTHTGNLQYSFDFNLGSGPNSEENPAFGKWVYSPVKGKVIKVVNNVTDFTYNSSSIPANNNGYGNEVIIKVQQANFEDFQYYVRILHFKKDSIQVAVGDEIGIGATLGQIGQTGYSTGPHLHIHMTYDEAGKYSIPFDFIEGPVSAGSWYESALTPRSNLLDNDKSINAGSDFLWSTTAYSRTYWYSDDAGGKYTGEDYVQTTQAGAKFKWKFKLFKPGYYLVMVRFPAHSNGDTHALYRVLGSQYYVNQAWTTETGWNSLAFKYFPVAGLTYQISLEATTQGKHVTADAIDMIRIW